MSLFHVFDDSQLAEQSESISLSLAEAFGGIRADVCLAALFSTFIAVCKVQGTDPGTAFEGLLSILEERAATTHRGNLRIH